MGRRIAAIAALGFVLLSVSSPASAAEAHPLRVTVGTLGAIGSLDPRHGNSPVAHEVWNLQYPTLTALDPKTLGPAPGVASGWVPLEGGRGWRYTVRKGLTWSDGKPVSAADVVYSLEHARDEHWPYAGTSLTGLRARAIDDRTVEVASSSATQPPAALALHVVPAPVYSAADDIGTDVRKLGVADGAWRVVAANGDSVQLDAVDPVNGPAVKQIVFRTYPSSGALIDALATKQVDIVSGVPATGIDRIEHLSDVTVNHAGDGTKYVLRFIGAFPPDAQRALSLAIDRDQLVTDAVHGVGTAAPVDAQPEQAKADLAALGIASSTPLGIAFPHDPTSSRVGEAVRRDLAAAGVHTKATAARAGLEIDRVPASQEVPDSVELFQPDTLQAFRSDNVTGWLRDPERRRLVVFGPTVAQYGQLSAAGTPPREASSNSVYALGAVIVLVLCGALFWIASMFRRRYVTAEETDGS